MFVYPNVGLAHYRDALVCKIMVCSYHCITTQMRSVTNLNFYPVIQILLLNIAIYFTFPSCNPACLKYYWEKIISILFKEKEKKLFFSVKNMGSQRKLR